MSETLDAHRELWTTDKDKYVLVRLEAASGGTSECIIFNKVDHTTWLIEDEDIVQAVIKRMAEAGVPIVGPEILQKKPAK